MSYPFPVCILGPQRLQPTLIESVRRCGVIGKIATVTAGWQEREDEDEELHEHLEGKTVNLRLYNRAERVYEADTALYDALRARQVRLQELQRLYRMRLDHTLEAARELIALDGDSPMIEEQRAAAIESVRRLDEEHLTRVMNVHSETDTELALSKRETVLEQRAELKKALAGTEAVAIAGGHVAVLLNRLRLFDLPSLVGDRPLFLWSAGAMACSEKVVLFHDSPPQGAGNAEVFEVGLGLVKGLVLLPHARRRLRLEDSDRVSLFARRFSPATCIALDDGALLELEKGHWVGAPGTPALLESGGVHDIVQTAAKPRRKSRRAPR